MGGVTVPLKDTIIAASAQVYGLTVATRNVKDFLRGDAVVILDQRHRNGGYYLGIDDAAPPQPDVAPEDREWVEQLLREQGLRERPDRYVRRAARVGSGLNWFLQLVAGIRSRLSERMQQAAHALLGLNGHGHWAAPDVLHPQKQVHPTALAI